MAWLEKLKAKRDQRLSRGFDRMEKRLLKTNKAPKIVVKAYVFEVDDYLARGWEVVSFTAAGFTAVDTYLLGIDRSVLENRHGVKN